MEIILRSVPGVDLIVAENAEIGMAMAMAEVPDLILMDIQLPGIDGIEATKVLRKRPETSRIPIVAVTAGAMKADLERARQAGFHAYVTKPINIPEMLAVLRDALTPQDGH